MESKVKLWTRSFLILWQSQLVSTMGDAVYAIALGFWVLEATGSTALMGVLMAASTLPGVLLSPFAGVLIDRSNKKLLMIAMDVLRGAAVVLLAAAAYAGLIQIWMVFAAGILLSASGAVFGPGISSAIPDLVPVQKIANANSAFATVGTGANLVGSAAGGFLYTALGAPLLFLLNGLSFLFSGASLPFVKIPSVKHDVKPQFFKDMADGFRYMWHQKGLRFILILAAVINFFCAIAIMLFLPLCQTDPTLGSEKYGLLMASFMGGSMVGFAAMSIINVKPKDKMRVFVIASILSNTLTLVAVNQPVYIVMLILLVLAGLLNSIVNVQLISTVQTSVPSEMRGKVMSFMMAATQGLTPFAMALGGVFGELFPIRLVITVSFAIGFLVMVTSYFSKSFKEYLTQDNAAQSPAA